LENLLAGNPNFGGKYRGKIEILSTHISSVGNLQPSRWKVASSCTTTIFTHDAAARNYARPNKPQIGNS